jgi:tetratricopeptide (TPR) repeat protein
MAAGAPVERGSLAVAMRKLDEALQKGMAALQAGRAAEAERCFRKAVEIAPDHFGALNLLVVALNGLRRFDEAEKIAARALRIDASSDATHYNYASVLMQNGKLDEAIAAFDRALAINPSHAKAFNNRGAALAKLKRDEAAIADFDRAIALDPRYADAYFNKANALIALKRRKEARLSLERTLALNPRHAGAYASLIDLFNELGEHAKAEECGRRALAIDPNLAEAYINLAVLENGRGRHPVALKWLDAALARHPDNLIALCMRILRLVEFDRLDEARTDFERLKGLTPNDAREHAESENANATLWLAEGRFEETLAIYERAVARADSGQEYLMVKRGETLAIRGDGEAALRAFDQALELYPTAASAWFGRADLVKFTPDDPSVAAMEALLAPEADTSYGDRLRLQFALGKAYLDIGDSPAAFRHLNAGNRLERSFTPYSAEATHKAFGAIAETFSADLLARLADQGARSSRPIFVVGMPRSGTTLIEQILAAHPAVHGAGELSYMGAIVDGIRDYPRGVEALEGKELERLGQDYLARIHASSADSVHVVDKNPGNFVHAGLIRLILPEARIIHSRRDPVDTCLSCYSKLFNGGQAFTYDLTDLGRFHRDYQTLMAHWRALLPSSHFLEVDYEAVVDDLESEARRMLAFLELPWDPACLEFHRVERVVRTASLNQVRQPIYRTSSGRWRKHAEALQPLLAALEIEVA